MSVACAKQIFTLLSKDDLAQMLTFTNRCLTCGSEKEFNDFLATLSGFLDFEFVLYAYVEESYQGEEGIHLVNLSNPEEWAYEYKKQGYLLHDPVRLEMERMIAEGRRSGYILWDDYQWDLSSAQQQVIRRRNRFGLHHGFSFFVDSESKNFAFLFSFASTKTIPSLREKVVCELLGPHLMAARKRVVVLETIRRLSEKERMVATHIMEGNTNREIAECLNITSNTIKFHIKNIFRKLNVKNRQEAIALLLASRYLGV